MSSAYFDLSMDEIILRRWRQGSKVKENIYVQMDKEPSDKDHILLTVSTPQLAEHICTFHNVTVGVGRMSQWPSS